MAENSSAKKLKSTLIYLDSTKIFKRRFLTLYNKSKEKGFNVVSEFSSNVGIIVTESSFVDDFVALRNIAADVSNLDFVKTQWLSNCLREGRILEIAEENRVPNKQPPAAPSCDPSGAFSEYECQRRTPLKHCNLIFTQALRILERDAVLKGDEQNNSRALAFRRGMCTIASLENPIKRWSDIKGLPHIGKHIELVVQDILETGHSEEAECIQSSVWFKVVDGVFGVGPSTAQKWFNAGFRNICDVIQSSDVQNHRDERLLYGLAFHADLNIPVCKSEAVFWEDLVKKELAAIDPEATVTLTGGFSSYGGIGTCTNIIGHCFKLLRTDVCVSPGGLRAINSNKLIILAAEFIYCMVISFAQCFSDTQECYVFINDFLSDRCGFIQYIGVRILFVEHCMQAL
ncbi:hypothetical protein CAPTEDRAFT_213338 [Capitella teleta]|uniref:BRCT domain-containing protein n=1 Tax=Capitella teleta TaxID=283909 RepID=R7TPZ3_CAPTE|nr:hypothetical protein CAPTEDRAFT_213338 [Capitella teleta]|eukprot:ELT95637.1 hypothetical protein CAPTEDRAFT_213338 [Capitella teleta]